MRLFPYFVDIIDTFLTLNDFMISLMKQNAFDTVNKKYTINKMSNNFIQALNSI